MKSYLLAMTLVSLLVTLGCSEKAKDQSDKTGSQTPTSPNPADPSNPSNPVNPTPALPVDPTPFSLGNPADNGTVLTWPSIQIQGFSGTSTFSVSSDYGTLKVCKLENSLCPDWNQANSSVTVSANEYIQVKLDYGATPPLTIITTANLGNYSISTSNDFFDSDFSKVVLLMHMDEVGTSFIESAKNLTVANSAGVTQVTGLDSFGKAGQFDSTHGPLKVPDSSDWNIGTGSYTVEAMYRFDALPGSGGAYYLIGSFYPGVDTNWLLYLIKESDGTCTMRIFHGRAAAGYVVNANYISAKMNLTIGSWYNLAFTYDGSNLRFFKDGTLLNTVSQTIGFGDSNYSLPLAIGSNHIGENKVVGLIDEVRITKGLARYTGNYTPAIRPYFNQ